MVHGWHEWLLTLFLCLVMAAPAGAVQSGTQHAEEADAFLVLLDRGFYEEAWSSMSELFQALSPKPQWINHTRTIRTAYGPLIERQQKLVSSRPSYKNSPDGQYLLIQYATVFTHKAMAVETIVLDCRTSDTECQIREYIIN